MIVNRVLQDPLEEHRQLAGWLARVVLGQLQHCVLHDVECGVLVADGEHRLLESTPLDVREKARNFLMVGQFAKIFD